MKKMVMKEVPETVCDKCGEIAASSSHCDICNKDFCCNMVTGCFGMIMVKVELIILASNTSGEIYICQDCVCKPLAKNDLASMAGAIIAKYGKRADGFEILF